MTGEGLSFSHMLALWMHRLFDNIFPFLLDRYKWNPSILSVLNTLSHKYRV